MRWGEVGIVGACVDAKISHYMETFALKDS